MRGVDACGKIESQELLLSSPGEASVSTATADRDSGWRATRLGRRLLELAGLVTWLTIVIGAVAFSAGMWIVDTFGHITPDQALLNLDGAGGDGGGGRELVRDALSWSVLAPVLVVVSAWITVRLVRRISRKRSSRVAFLATYVVPAVAFLAVPALGIWSLGGALQIRDYLAAGDPSLNLDDYYTKPAIEEGTEAEPVNLVLIYLESIENAFADEEVFGMNMLEDIQRVTEGWESIEELEQYPGGGWTMAGIVSTQCGVPLRMPPSSGISGTAVTDQAQPANKIETEKYMPGATCLGDVLYERGYTNVFMGGAYASYASKGQFLREHGFSSVLGREIWEREGETELTEEWGLSDGRLLERAKDEIAALSASGEPFFLNILTLDTHEPAPLFDYCEQESSTALTDATRCSMKVVASFIEHMEDQGYLENTVVVLMGDHLKFTSTKYSYGSEFTDYPDRTIFNRIWIPGGRGLRVSRVDQLDMYPTILEAMGFELEAGRAGLGISAYNPDYVFGSLRELSPSQREVLIKSRSEVFYHGIWND